MLPHCEPDWDYPNCKKCGLCEGTASEPLSTPFMQMHWNKKYRVKHTILIVGGILLDAHRKKSHTRLAMNTIKYTNLIFNRTRGTNQDHFDSGVHRTRVRLTLRGVL